MTGLGMGGSARPKARLGDFERAAQFNVSVNGDLKTREYLKELVTAQAAHDAARENAEVAVAESKRREGLAREAEADARSQRTSLAIETAETDRRLSAERQELAGERQRLGEWAKELEDKDSELTTREAAMQRAFDAYQGD